MKYESCKDCSYCEYHDEVEDGVKYKGFYCGGFDYLTDEARLENIDQCEYADEVHISVKKQLEPLYDEICAKLTDYEHCKDPETTNKDWLEEFYLLLVKTQNSIDTLEENF